MVQGFKSSPYTIRQVDGFESEDELRELQTATSDFPLVNTTEGWWWVAYLAGLPVAYLGAIPSTVYPNALYFTRVGVLAKHRGNNLQLRLMRKMERLAIVHGLSSMVSDTTHAVHSANNFIRAGWRLFEPECPWAFADSLYWRKDLVCR